MKPMTAPTIIQAPVEKVFAALMDVPNWPNVIPGIKKIEMVTPGSVAPGPTAVGTRFKETRVMFGKDCTEEMRFEEIVPNKGYTLKAHNCGVDYTMLHTFAPTADGGTRMMLYFDSKAVSLFAKLFKPMMFLRKGMMRKKLQADLEAIKKACEAA